MPLILPGNVASALGGGYEVANSLRVNENDSPRLHKTNGTPTSRRKFTFSCWVKRASLDEESDMHMIFNFNGNSNRFYVGFFGDKLRVNATKSGDGTTAMDLKTNRMFRDFSAWYSIVVAVDTEQGTAANRVKIYINGTQETSFATETYPAEDDDIHVNESDVELLEFTNAAVHFFDGYIAEIVYVDGTQEAVTSFGEFDEDSPTIWKPKNVSGLTFGTNGFYLDFEDSSNLGNDANGGTDFTEVNIAAIDQSLDSPTNNFCTFNPLFGAETQAVNTTFSEGNLAVVNSGSVYNPYGTTIGVNKGKWYAEFKANANMGDGNIGIFAKLGASGDALSSQTQQYSWYFTASAGNIRSGGSNIVTSVGTIAANDIIGIALDCNNSKLYMHKNGTYISNGTGTGNPSSGTNGISITDPDDTDLGVYFMTAMDWGGSTRGNWFANFGSPSFTISSSNSDANGYGSFEHSVPSGYLAICTKNLGSDGG